MRNKEYYPFYLILAVNVIYFAAVIACFPGFETDDFLLFSRIKSNPYPFAVNPNEAFYLFLRPVSYFSFYLDFLFWMNSPVLMKVFSLLLHLIFLSSFYLLLNRISLLFSMKFNGLLAGIILLLLTFHPDISIWMIWIANRTELLYILFYSLSILSAAEYLLSEKRPNLYLSAYGIFYLLSILSKAQSLHLPVLMLFLSWVFREKFDKRKISALIKVSAGLLVITVLFVIANYLLFSPGSVFFNYLHRKPFLMLGVLLYSVFPYWAESIYVFFVHNKLHALVSAIALLTAAAVYVKRNRIQLKHAGYLIIFAVIIFIPRMTLEPINRINSVQIFWVFIALYLIGIKYYNKRKSAVLFPAAVYFLLSAFYNYESYGLHNKYLAENMAQINRFNEAYDPAKEKIVVLTALNNILIPSQTYYNREKTFGSYDIVMSPVFVFHQMYSWKGLNASAPLVRVSVNGDICTIENTDPQVQLYYAKITENEPAGFKIFDVREYPDSWVMKSCKMRIPEKYLNSGYKLVYYDGEEWREF